VPREALGALSLVAAALAFVAAWRAQARAREGVAVLLICAGALFLRAFAASDPFLHEWDERFHALVAKNLASHPLVPTLYDDPALPFD
jgi:4-amino-4-deoxy-L-arabinose transferase